jgi:hypothetical protein
LGHRCPGIWQLAVALLGLKQRDKIKMEYQFPQNFDLMD